MSSGVKGGASRVSIPSGVKTMIENIKEITGQNHTEDEIYAMLKECSMDPNETTQKLLLLDTFHEVKRKRDRKKENLHKEPVEIKWKQGTQARANRVGRGNYPSRYISNDVGGGRNLAAGKENPTIHIAEKATSKAPLATPQDVRKNDTPVSSPITAVSNGPSGIAPNSTSVIHDNHASADGGFDQSNTTASMSKSEGPLLLSSHVDSVKNPNGPGTKDIHQHQMLEISNSAASVPSAPAPGSYFSSSDPILLPSQESPLPSIRREVGSQRAPVELIDDNSNENKSTSAKISAPEVGFPTSQQKMPKDTQVVGKNQHLDMQAASSAVGSSTVSRPSSNYNNRSQVIGPQKVIPGKEWKPKSTNSNVSQGATAALSSELPTISVGAHSVSQTSNAVLTSKEATLQLQRKLEESHISDSKHVIIPNHLHVPEVEKLGFCFGSFDSSFELDMNQTGDIGSDKTPQQFESSEATEVPVNELELSNQNAIVSAEDTEIKYPDHPQSPSEGPGNFSSNDVEVSASTTPDFSEPKPEVATGSHQHPVVHPSSNYSYGFMPPILSGQLTPSESSESQARDPRLPGFVVPQAFDPANYYAQLYRAGLDGDGRISPFHTAGAANKYNGNAALVPAQNSQSPQELQGGVPLVLSTASPTPLVTQAAGVMQSTIPATQQPLPVFRQPTGVHLPHYPPNYIPYGPYFSPFYVPPPAIHQFLSNGAFPQQPQAGNLYSTAAGTNAKYSVSQYNNKQGQNTGSSAHMGSYGPYGLSMPNYSSTSAPAPLTSTSNDDIAAAQVKENNIYVSGQQNEGSGVWFSAPGRDISTLQPNSFYNLPQGQLAFTPTQAAHGAFTGIFHHPVAAANVHQLLQQSQAITSPVDMVVPTAGVYQQQPQHAQLNWPSNY